MSKPTRASINLGNVTHARGFNDGLNGRPKTIKKSHAHAHRYHTGYLLGVVERDTSMRSALTTNEDEVVTRSYIRNPEKAVITSYGNIREAEKALREIAQNARPVSLWDRFMTWFRG